MTRPSDSLTKQATYLPSNLSSSAKLSYFVKARSGNSSTGRDCAKLTVILRNTQPVFGGTVLVAYPVSVRVSHFISVRSLGNERKTVFEIVSPSVLIPDYLSSLVCP
jgi:hypothetical protein